MKLKNLLATALVGVMMLGASLGVCAKEYPVSYVQGSSQATNNAVDVTVTVEGINIPYTEIPVSLGAKTSGNQVVRDAMLEINDEGTSVFFLKSKDSYDFIASDTTYFERIIDGEGNDDIGNGTGYSGWCFRINGGTPMESEGWGASIATATITDGDVISFYLDNPIAESSAARFTSMNNVSYSNGVVSATVLESHQYFGPAPDYAWTITPFAAVSGATVKVYNAAGTEVGTGTTSSVGVALINVNTLASGTYTVKVLGTHDSLFNITLTSVAKTFVVE